MPATFAQSKTSAVVTSGKTVSAQYDNNIGSGSMLLAVVQRTVTGHNTPACAIHDDIGNKWKQAGEGCVLGTPYGVGYDHGLDMWYCEKPLAGNRPTVTATLQGYPNGVLGSMVLFLLEYPGFTNWEPWESSGVVNITGTTGTATTRDSVSANGLAVSVIVHNGSAATVPAGWNSRINDTTRKFAVADLLDTGSAGTEAAAWTGITGNTKGFGLIVVFKPAGTKVTNDQRCVALQYRLEELFSDVPIGKAISPAFISPVVGNSMILYTSPYVGNNVIDITDDHGNKWEQLFDGQFDPYGAGNNSMWICRRAQGTTATITITAHLVKGQGSQLWNQTFYVLMEYANLPADIAVLTSGDEVSEVNIIPSDISTVASVPSGSLVIGAIGGGAEIFGTLDNAAGWKTRFSDSGAEIGIIEKVPTSSGVQTASWTYAVQQVASFFVLGLGSPTPTSSGIVATQRRVEFDAPQLPGHIGQRAESIEWELLESDLTSVGILTPLDDGASVQNSLGSDIMRTLDNLLLSEYDCHEINFLTARIRPVWVMDDMSRWPMGAFMFSASDRRSRSRPGQTTRGMSMYDQNDLLLDPRREAFGILRGASIRNAMIQLVEECHIPLYNIGATGAIAGDDLAWPPATPRLKILMHLCALSGMLRPYFDNWGVLIIRSSPDLDSVEPDITYDTGPTSRILEETIVDSQDKFRLPNIYLVTATGVTESEISAYALVPATMPHSVQNLGREIVEPINLPGITDTNAGFKVAEVAAAQKVSDYFIREYETSPDPRHDTMQIIGFDSINYREVSWDLPCKYGAKMKHSLRLTYSLVQNPSETAPSGVGEVNP
jgi:hypothetical protein